MIEESDDFMVVNVREASWFRSPAFGWRCRFEGEPRFSQTGVNLSVLEPGKPGCRYHRENAQEDFLVLSGECILLVNGEERRLKAWDFVHCAPGVTHVFVGAGDGPCAILAIGHRPQPHELFYPSSEVARRHGAETTEPTPDPRVAYSDVPRWEPSEPHDWPLGG